MHATFFVQVVVMGDLTVEGLFVSMGGLFGLDMRLLAATTDVRTVIVPHADEARCKEVQLGLITEGVERVDELQFVGAKTIWDAVETAFSGTLALHREALKVAREAALLDEQRPPQTLNTPP
jgi:ATP-dependent Lon protease